MPLHHLGIIVKDLESTRKFYSAALKPLGYQINATSADGGDVVAFGIGQGLEFLLSGPNSPTAKKAAAVGGNSVGIHPAFAAKNKEEVKAFYEAALYVTHCRLLLHRPRRINSSFSLSCLHSAAGGTDNGAPGPRPQYAPGYYGAFVIDPEGRNVEAVYIEPA